MQRILVTAPEGRKTPIASSDGSSPGGGQLYVEQGDVVPVSYSSSIRRSISRGDLIPCTESGLAAESLDDAQASEGFEPIFAINMPPQPDDQQPLPDSGGLQRDRVRRRPPPAPHAPQPQPPGVEIPNDVSMKGAHPNMDASSAPSFDTSDRSKGR
jgi:hypothetical protein